MKPFKFKLKIVTLKILKISVSKVIITVGLIYIYFTGTFVISCWDKNNNNKQNKYRLFQHAYGLIYDLRKEGLPGVVGNRGKIRGNKGT